MNQRNGTLVNRKFNEFFLPTVMLSMAMGISIIVDAMIVGNVLGSKAMVAVNLVTPITLCVNMFSTLFAIGGSTCVSLAKGKRENQKANELFTVSLLLFVVVGIIMMLLGVIFIDDIAQFLTKGGDLMGLVRAYTLILSVGTPLLILVMGSIYFVRADGMPKLASIVIAVANIINLSLDLVFMKVLHMGIQGAAYATVTGYACGALILLIYCFSKKRTLKLVTITNPVEHIKEIVSYGSTASLGQGLLFIKNLIINSIVMITIGEVGMVAYSVCISTLALISMFIGGGSQTMIPLLGTFLGEHDVAGIKYTARKTFQVVFSLTVICAIGIELFPTVIFSLFGVADAAGLAVGIPALRIFSISTIGVAFSFMMMYYLQTINQTKIAIEISVCEGLLIIIPCVFLLSRIFGAIGIWSSFVITEIITAFFIIYQVKKVEKNTNGKVKGLFLLEQVDDSVAVFDLTVGGTAKDAVSLSEQVEAFAKKQKMSPNTTYQISMLAEEVVANIVAYNGGKILTAIDVIIRVENKKITMNVRDDGKPFDAMYYSAEEKQEFTCSNIEVIQKIAKKVEYARVIGLNTIVLELEYEK